MSEYEGIVEPQSQQPPEFNGGSFLIHHFAPPEGFTIQSRSLARREGLSIPFPARAINQGNREEVAYQKREDAKAALEGRKRNVNPLRSPHFKVKVGILNIKRDGKVLSFDTKPSTFVAYNDEKNVGLTVPANQQLRDELGSILGVAMIIFTTEPDGSHRMIVQHRSPKNRSYGDIIGASAAGLADQELGEHGALKPIDEAYVRASVYEEMEEEVGIDQEHIVDIRTTGLAEDLIKPHHEMLLLGRTSLSAKEVEEIAERKKNVERSEFDFSEKFFVLDGSAEAIKTLVTKGLCPIPPTHMAALIAAGRILKSQQDGEEAAAAWTKEVEEGSRINTQQIDEIVRAYTNNEQQGYNPKIIPTVQGLPDVVSELKRLGLIVESEETLSASTPDNAWVFDIDGVITNLDQKEVTKPEIIDEIIYRLKANEPVALVTGRSLPWVLEKVVAKLEAAATNPSLLNNLFIAAEFGGISVKYVDGAKTVDVDQSLTVSQGVIEKAIRTVEGQFSDVAFVDLSKMTHFTAEMILGTDLPTFRIRQQELSRQLTDLVEQLGLSESLEVHNDSIATNIKNNKLNKHLATQKVLAWLKEKGIDPQSFNVFGDSMSDLQMGDELTKQGRAINFVYVGPEENLGEHSFNVIRPQGEYDLATLNYLQSLKKT